LWYNTLIFQRYFIERIPTKIDNMKELSTEELIQALNNNNKNLHTVISRMSNDEKEAALDTLADAFKEDPYFSWIADFQSGDTEKERKM